MYTREDYIKDKYISENGEGIEKFYAKRRVIAYEVGSDTDDIEYIGSEMEKQKRIRKAIKRREFFLPYAITSSIMVFVFSSLGWDLVCILSVLVAIIFWILALD